MEVMPTEITEFLPMSGGSAMNVAVIETVLESLDWSTLRVHISSGPGSLNGVQVLLDERAVLWAFPKKGRFQFPELGIESIPEALRNNPAVSEGANGRVFVDIHSPAAASIALEFAEVAIAIPKPSSRRSRAGAAPVRHQGKYQPLSEWLERQSEDEIDITFAEIEAAMGMPLPPSSRKHVPHWHSYEGSAVVRAIEDAGWKASKVDLSGERLHLSRSH